MHGIGQVPNRGLLNERVIEDIAGDCAHSPGSASPEAGFCKLPWEAEMGAGRAQGQEREQGAESTAPLPALFRGLWVLCRGALNPGQKYGHTGWNTDGPLAHRTESQAKFKALGFVPFF